MVDILLDITEIPLDLLEFFEPIEPAFARDVFRIPTSPYSGAHFATFPPKLIEPCILAGCPAGGVVFDPFGGSGTTGFVAQQLGRRAIMIELNPEYAKMAQNRCAQLW